MFRVGETYFFLIQGINRKEKYTGEILTITDTHITIQDKYGEECGFKIDKIQYFQKKGRREDGRKRTH